MRCPRFRVALPLPLVLALGLGACDTDPTDTEPAVAHTDVRALVQQAAEGEHRSSENQQRNRYRNPAETLEFFGLQPDWTVVEVWPGGGWYTEVLAPVLRQRGRLVAASYPEDAEGFRGRIGRQFNDKLGAHPGVYDRVEVIDYGSPHGATLGEPESADMVLLSRHFHNFIREEIVEEVLADARAVLRPGGVLAVIQHRADEDAVAESEQRTGYVRQSWLVEQVEQAGFRLDGESEVNANPDDRKAYPAGVWTLPPSLRHCGAMEDDEERAECERRYREIGESDRMTLRFIKPEA